MHVSPPSTREKDQLVRLDAATGRVLSRTRLPDFGVSGIAWSARARSGSARRGGRSTSSRSRRDERVEDRQPLAGPMRRRRRRSSSRACRSARSRSQVRCSCSASTLKCRGRPVSLNPQVKGESNARAGTVAKATSARSRARTRSRGGPRRRAGVEARGLVGDPLGDGVGDRRRLLFDRPERPGERAARPRSGAGRGPGRRACSPPRVPPAAGGRGAARAGRPPAAPPARPPPAARSRPPRAARRGRHAAAPRRVRGRRAARPQRAQRRASRRVPRRAAPRRCRRASTPTPGQPDADDRRAAATTSR